MSVERNIFSKEIDEVSKLDGTLREGHDGVMDLLLDRFSTVVDRDISALREIPSDFSIYQHFDEYPSGYHYDHLFKPDHDGHLIDYDLNHELIEHPAVHH